ncbi:HNH endonuclease [Streptomyces brasiliscabiei]|uniref:HNH endonuclease n=1 Tax=Streptomyces brasiliscabiei TaxID=2736302 RepID=UPI001C114720|nr:hypothetical protein [Streptomyces brasiliscabiei]
MIRIPLPRVSSREAYAACLEMIKDPETKEAYEAAIDFVENCVSQFERHAQTQDLHLLDSSEFRPERDGELTITSKDLSDKLYTDRMAHAKSSGRRIYDQIQLAAPNGVCPLCGIRRVTTLDHYLPKASFAALSVAPLNLIPACSDCNKFKLDVAPAIKEEQTLIPYFEDASDVQWLRCDVIKEEPATVWFTVVDPPHYPTTLINRVRHHFKVFRLGELYAHHANTDMRSIRMVLRGLFEILGPQGVRDYLKDHAKSAYEAEGGRWKSAMYNALAESDWYCRGGFDAQAI